MAKTRMKYENRGLTARNPCTQPGAQGQPKMTWPQNQKGFSYGSLHPSYLQVPATRPEGRQRSTTHWTTAKHGQIQWGKTNQPLRQWVLKPTHFPSEGPEKTQGDRTERMGPQRDQRHTSRTLRAVPPTHAEGVRVLTDIQIYIYIYVYMIIYIYMSTNPPIALTNAPTTAPIVPTHRTHRTHHCTNQRIHRTHHRTHRTHTSHPRTFTVYPWSAPLRSWPFRNHAFSASTIW